MHGRLTVHTEVVTPCPWIPSYQCAEIQWLSKETTVMTCYVQVMGNRACRKRLLTYHNNRECTCCPSAMAACDIALVTDNGACDLAPLTLFLAGPSLSNGRALVASALFYVGRV